MSIKHSDNFIKGKIAEAIFEEMFHSQGEFEVIRNGYEYTHPEIAQNLKKLDKEKFKLMRSAPDFILLSWKEKEQYLVEVKFRKIKIDEEVLKLARKIYKVNPSAYLFLATKDRFYFQSCEEILKDRFIDILSEDWISKEIQEKYLQILNKHV